MNPKLKMLCDLYKRIDKNVDINSLLKVCFFNSLEDIIRLCSKKQCLKFSYLCAKSIFHLCDNDLYKEKAKNILRNAESLLLGDRLNDKSIEYSMINSSINLNPNDINYYFIILFDELRYLLLNTTMDGVLDVNYYLIRHIEKYRSSVDAEEQKYKNLGFLVQVVEETNG